MSGSNTFFMPTEDAARVRTVADAARETGMARSVAEAYAEGQSVYGVAFPTNGMKITAPTAADAAGWPHFLEGGHTAVRGDGFYLVNQTREFVTPGGNPMPPGSVLFELAPDGSWRIMRRW
jgi:hypothetical protein